MQPRGPEGGCWPSHEQRLLLSAALLDREPALAAWDQWKAHTQLGDVDPASTSLLPLLFRNLSTLGVPAGELQRLRGVYRHTWYRNQLHGRSAGSVLRLLSEAGIPTLVLKGLALTHLYYRDHGARPMHDCDIAVPREHVFQAYAVMVDAGWTAQHPPLERELVSRPGTPLRDQAGNELDLHWHIMASVLDPELDSALWSEAIETEIDGCPTRALCPSHQLLHLLVHGLAWSKTPGIRWVADTAMVIRDSGPQLDAELLCATADRWGLRPWLTHGLDYLARLGVPVSSVCSGAEGQVQASLSARLHFFFRTHCGPQAIWGELPALWFRYRSTLGEARPSLSGFIRFLRSYWRIQEGTPLSLALAEKVTRRGVWMILSLPDRLRRTLHRR